jgi:hypothetical protein
VGDPRNWVELMMTRSLVVVGTSLDEAEWDLWYAFLMRWRNFAKAGNKNVEYPGWVLSAGPEGGRASSLHELQRHRF